MTQPQQQQIETIVATVKLWPPEMRHVLAQRVLEVGKAPLPAPRGVPIEEMLGVARGNGPPPSDEEVKQWLAERRLEKHGP